eukprot:m.505996 g.505996  ORF g.505996 m.505996 type:complete len:52 (+) comp21868_c0_seq10:57-212(+)
MKCCGEGQQSALMRATIVKGKSNNDSDWLADSNYPSGTIGSGTHNNFEHKC